jgi:hypothetical protein
MGNRTGPERYIETVMVHEEIPRGKDHEKDPEVILDGVQALPGTANVIGQEEC